MLRPQAPRPTSPIQSFLPPFSRSPITAYERMVSGKARFRVVLTMPA